MIVNVTPNNLLSICKFKFVGRCCGIQKVLHLYGHYFSNIKVIGICFFFFQAEDGIRVLVRSRGLGDV